MKFEFSAETTTYASKPTKQEAASISNNLQPVYIESIDGFGEDIQQGIS